MNNESRKTIVQFVGRLSDGGAEALIRDYAILLNRQKFDVKIVVIRPDNKTAMTKILQENNAEIIPIYPHFNIFTRVFNRFFGKRFVPYQLARILKRENVDVLHVHLGLLHHVVKIAHRIKGMRIFYTCHNLPRVFFFGKREVEFGAAQKLIQDNGLQLIALHEDMRAELNDMFGIDTTVVIRNGIDFSKFMEIEESQEEIREALRIPKDAFVVGHVGRFDDVKNHKFLVEIFRELCQRKENAYLLMVGVGPLKADVENSLQQYGLDGKYQILSHRNDIPQLMKAMDVFVFPSKYEGLPIVLIEAQVVSLKCVISDSITEEILLTDTIVQVSLNESPKKWCDIILDDSIRGKASSALADYDMRSEIKRLEKLYLGELHE